VHEGREGYETVRKPQGSARRPKAAVPAPLQEGTRVSGVRLAKPPEEKDRLKQEPSYRLLLLSIELPLPLGLNSPPRGIGVRFHTPRTSVIALRENNHVRRKILPALPL
jgi:hypothetical protein